MKTSTREAELKLKDGRRVAVKLAVNPRARRVSVRIDAAKREAIATAPSERQLKRALSFAAERAFWIAEELERLPKGQPFAPGETIPILGRPHVLVRVHGRGAPCIEDGRLIVPTLDPDLFAARVRRFLIAHAKDILSERVAAHAHTIGARYQRITMKDTRSRWGSCSSDGAMSFSWRIIFAPMHVLDYLAAHETAHLKEMNHSRRFWALVAKCTPQMEKGREWLRTHGVGLHAIGAE
ncbi:MAG: M48 family metallopeptidase [Hyphomonadaceae bacterium]